jgi:Ran GTPase-activating protein (RanGAP) involved in mRNA processing and transport
MHLRDEAYLDLCSKQIDCDHTTEIAHELATNTTLTYLKLNENAIGDNGARAIANALTKNRTLGSIDLRGNSIGDAGAVAIAMALLQSTSLKTLYLQSNGIGPAGAIALSETLRTNTCLQVLGLGQNIIGENGTEALAGALATNQSLVDLSLPNCSIGNVGATALARSLRSNVSLTTLYFGGNKFGTTGLISIAFALAGNKVLTVLYLDASSINDDGVAILAEMLRGNTSLKHLSLRSNSISDSGAAVILNALTKCNATLTSLNLTHNTNISASALSAIEEILKANIEGTRSFVHPIASPAPTTLTPPPASVPQQAPHDAEREPESRMPQATTNEAGTQSVIHPDLRPANPSTASAQRQVETPEFEATPSPEPEMPQATTNEVGARSVFPAIVRQGRYNANPPATSLQLQAPLETEPECGATLTPQAEMFQATTTPNFHGTQDSANGEDKDGETEPVEGLPKQRAELEYAIRLLEPIRNAAEQKISLMQGAIASGNYPTGDELELRVTDLTEEIQGPAQVESLAAASSLQRLLQLQSDFTRERDAEVRVREAVRKRSHSEAMVDAHRQVLTELTPRPMPAPGTSSTSVEFLVNRHGTQDSTSDKGDDKK